MPRKYILKKPLPSYSLDDVVHAVADVQNKNITFRAAQEAYGVPVSVIYNRINGRRTPLEKIGQGRGNALPLEVESEIVKFLLQRSSSGYPCDKEELRELIAQYVVSNNLKTPFHNSKPGEEWYCNFMKRNPVLSLKKPELLQKCRKDARKPEIIYDFYNKLKKVVMECGLNDEKSNFVFNADESGFCSDPNKLRAIGQKGVSFSGSGRESTTVLACVSADGYALPRLIIFKGAAVQARWTSNEAYPGTLYGASKNGWMEEPQFYHWFINGFIPHIISLREKQNVPGQAALLLYDGHSSHISVRIVEGAIKNNIQLLRFPSHLTDKLQPLDKAVFGPVKVAWEKVLVRYGKEMIGKGLFQLPKANFVKLLGTVWKTALIPKNIQAGFDSTGVFPVNASKFPETDFNQLELKKYYREILEIPPETIQNAEAEEPQTTPSNLSAPIQSQNNVQSSTSQPTQALNSMPQTFIERINSSSSSVGSPYIHANSGNVLVTQCTTTSLTSRSSSTSVIGAESPVSEQKNSQNVFSLPEDLSSFNELSPIPSPPKLLHQFTLKLSIYSLFLLNYLTQLLKELSLLV